jgi:hypothetical protein
VTQERVLIRRIVHPAAASMIAALLVALLPVMAPSLLTPAGAQTGAPPQAGPAVDSTAKSEAAEAWDAIKFTTNQALLEAFITRYGDTFFAEIAKVRLKELRANPQRPAGSMHAPNPVFPDVPRQQPTQPAQAEPVSPVPEEPVSTDGIHQRSVLYEEDVGNPSGRQYVGTAVWRTETIKTQGKPDELAIRGDVDIPSRGLQLTLRIRRNTDPALPASHTIELASHAAAGSDFGIANIPGMLMKSNEKSRGTPFAGLAVKVTDGFFMVGLSNVSEDRARNLNLLVERTWFDIPMTYTNNRRAILAIAKGETGDGAIKAALTAWGQYPATAPAGTAASPN